MYWRIRGIFKSPKTKKQNKTKTSHQIQFCIRKIILRVLEAIYQRTREMWPSHLKKQTKKNKYSPKKLSKWKILVFPPSLSKSAANFPLYLKSINSLHKRFLVQHRIPFDVKHTESSKVSLPLNIMTRQKPEQETQF